MSPQSQSQELERIKQKLVELQTLIAAFETKILNRPDNALGRSTPPPRGLPVSRPSVRAPDLESVIGVHWLVVTGVLAVIIAVGYGVRLAIERGWLTEELRCGVAALLGLGFLMVGYHLRHAHKRYGEVLMSGGVVTLFLAVYAAHYLYLLIPGPQAIVLILAIAIGSATLAWRTQASAPIYLGMLSCYIAPLLVDSLGRSLVSFFSFLCILNLAYLMLSVAVNLLPLLILCLYLANILYIWAWYHVFSRPAALWSIALTYQILQAMTFAIGATLPALLKRGQLSRQMTWSLFPVILFFYFFSSDLLLDHARSFHLPFALFVAGFFFYLAHLGRAKLKIEPAVHQPTLMTTMTLAIIGSHLILEHVDGIFQTWIFFIWFYVAVLGWNTLKRPRSLFIYLLAIFFILTLKLNFDVGYMASEKSSLIAFINSQFLMLAILGGSFLFWSTKDFDQKEFQQTALLIGHGLILRAVYLQVAMLDIQPYGAFFVSLFWLLYASLILGIGFAKKSEVLRKSALGLFAFCTFKVFLYDTLSASRLVKTASYFVLGMTLIIAGYVYQKARLTTLKQKTS